MKHAINSFKGTAGIVVAILLLCAIGFSFAGLKTGPKLENISFNSQNVTALSGQRVVLKFNQKLSPISAGKAQITPAANVRSETRNNQLVLAFADPLLAGVRYTVKATVKAAATGAITTVEHEFVTDPLNFTVLVPRPADTQTAVRDRLITYTVGAGAKKPEAQHKNSARQGAGQEVFSAPEITDFTRHDNWVAAVHSRDARKMLLTVKKIGGQESIEIAQTPTDLPRSITFSDDGALFGIKFFNGGKELLHIYPVSKIDPDTGRTIKDSSGADIPVAAWSFVPGGSEVVIKTTAGDYFAVGVGAAVKQISRDAAADKLQTVPGHDPLQEISSGYSEQSPHLPLQLTTSAQQRVTITADQKTLTVDGSQVYEPAAADSTLTGVCLSPNSQFALVRVAAANGQSQLTVIDIAGGRQVFTVVGNNATWCTAAM